MCMIRADNFLLYSLLMRLILIVSSFILLTACTASTSEQEVATGSGSEPEFSEDITLDERQVNFRGKIVELNRLAVPKKMDEYQIEGSITVQTDSGVALIAVTTETDVRHQQMRVSGMALLQRGQEVEVWYSEKIDESDDVQQAVAHEVTVVRGAF